jgi:predicted DNA-binding transcriptional regulator AlpA
MPKPKKKPRNIPPAKQVTGARRLASAIPPHIQVLGRHEIVALTGRSYPTIWAMMRKGAFPRSRILGGKSAWLVSEIEEWLSSLPTRPLKGDLTPEEAT